jgi:hypothetical protein
MTQDTTTKFELPFEIKDDFRLDIWKAAYLAVYDNPFKLGTKELTETIMKPAGLDNRAAGWVMDRLMDAKLVTFRRIDNKTKFAPAATDEPFTRAQAMAAFKALFGDVKMWKAKPETKDTTADHIISTSGSDDLKARFGI